MSNDIQLPLTFFLEDERIVAALGKAIALLESPGPMLQDIGDKLELNARLRFELEVDPTGKPWAPLSKRRLAEKRNHKPPLPDTILVATNRLRTELTHNVGDDYVEIGASRPTKGGKWQILMLHEFGTSRGMPRRGILTADPEAGRLGDEDLADITAIVNDALGDLF